MRFKILISWIGFTDLKAARGELGRELGPIGQAATQLPFSHIFLLSDLKKTDASLFKSWLGNITKAEINLQLAKLSGPTIFSEIYENALSLIQEVKTKFKAKDISLTYHVSPGTPAMAAVWILLAKTSHPAELIESSSEHGVKTVSFPFEMAAEYLPDSLRKRDENLILLTQGLPPETPEFDAIIHRCGIMKRLVTQARKVAIYDVPVLILGESGTGKELLARAIHASSSRKNGPFMAVNCGAVPLELFEAEFFGHEKGAFTGAVGAREGYLEKADGGTLFLDEIGDLPLPAQVKILRAIQEGTIQKIGSTIAKKIDVRIISATNRNLVQDVAEGIFREDLFHRLAVAVLQVPPLRERKGDLSPLLDHVLNEINRKSSYIPDWKHKKFSVGARNLLLQHLWPGNIRELINTLSRAAIWAEGETIQTEDIQEALFPVSKTVTGEGDHLNHDLDNDFNLLDLLASISRHYLKKALAQTNGNKTLAAKLLGLPNYQTLTNWLKKYGTGP